MKKTTQIKPRIYSTIVTGLLLSSSAVAKDKIDWVLGGYLMLDHDSFDAAFLEKGDSFDHELDFRRARLSLKANYTDNWKAKLQLGFADSDIEVKGAYFQYKGWNWADITLGKHKEAFGLEKLTSSRNLLMIERSMISEALAPGRATGISANGELADFNWQLGYFKPDETEDANAITGRLTWTPWQENNNVLHLGFAFSERDLNGSEFRINEVLEVNYSDSLLESEKLFADKQSLTGIELLWQQNGFTTMAEWQQADVTDINNNEYNYEGGYVQLSYQLSGDNRKYKNGSLGKVASSGWELTTRYSQFELIEEARKAQTYSVGVNYTVNKNLKFMADYIKAKQFDDGSEFDSGDAVSLRVQYSF